LDDKVHLPLTYEWEPLYSSQVVGLA